MPGSGDVIKKKRAQPSPQSLGNNNNKKTA